MMLGGDDVIGWVSDTWDTLSDPVGAVTDTISDGVLGMLDTLAVHVGEVTSQLLQGIIALLGMVTTPDVTATDILSSAYAPVARFSLALIALFLLVAVTMSVARGEVSTTVRKALVSMPVAVLGILTAPYFVQKLLGLSDLVSDEFGGFAGADVGAFMKGLAASSETFPAGNAVLGLLVLMMMLASGVVMFVVLLLRGAAVILVVALFPLMIAATVSEGVKPVFKRTVELLIAMIAAKPIMIIGLTIGTAVMKTVGDTSQAVAMPTSVGAGYFQGLGSLLMGSVILMCAGLAPVALFKLLPGMERAAAGSSLAGGVMTVAAAAGAAITGGMQLSKIAGMVGAGSGADGAGDSGVGQGEDSGAAGAAASALTGGAAGAAVGGGAPGGAAAPTGGDVAAAPGSGGAGEAAAPSGGAGGDRGGDDPTAPADAGGPVGGGPLGGGPLGDGPGSDGGGGGSVLSSESPSSGAPDPVSAGGMSRGGGGESVEPLVGDADGSHVGAKLAMPDVAVRPDND